MWQYLLLVSVVVAEVVIDVEVVAVVVGEVVKFEDAVEVNDVV